MKNFFKIAVCCLVITSLNGCGFLLPVTSNQNQMQTNVVLQSDNYRIIGTVQGQSSCTYILGIGGLSRKSLYQNSHANMLKNANLHGSQALINVSTQERISSILVYSKIEVVSTGTVIEFKEPTKNSITPQSTVSTPTKQTLVNNTQKKTITCVNKMTTDIKSGHEIKSMSNHTRTEYYDALHHDIEIALNDLKHSSIDSITTFLPDIESRVAIFTMMDVMYYDNSNSDKIDVFNLNINKLKNASNNK